MVSPYQSLISYQEDNWSEFLENCLLLDIFEPVIRLYNETGYLKPVIQYIVYAYSATSDKIVLGLDWHKNKKSIFEFVLAKPEKRLYEDLVLLKSEAVVSTIHRWLAFQENDSFAQLQVLKDLRVEMQISCLTDIKNASGEINYDQKYRNSEYSVKLKEKIKELEAELIQNDPKMKDAVKEVRSTKKTVNVGPETFSK